MGRWAIVDRADQIWKMGRRFRFGFSTTETFNNFLVGNSSLVSIIINIFGAVLFLQGGVVVGVSGLLLSMVICFIIIWMGLAAGCSGNFEL